MPKLKTHKTAVKRFRQTKPRGGKGAKIVYNKSRQGHLRTKKSARTKNRILRTHTVSPKDRMKISKLINA